MSLQDLLLYPIRLEGEGSGTLRETERILESMGLLSTASGCRVFGSTEAVKQAVKAGFGVSILSKMSVAEDLRQIP